MKQKDDPLIKIDAHITAMMPESISAEFQMLVNDFLARKEVSENKSYWEFEQAEEKQ